MFIEMIKYKKIMVNTLLLLATGACSSFSINSGYKEERASQIIPNVSSLTEVIELLGPPDAHSLKDNSIIYQYQRLEKGTQGKSVPIPAPKEILLETMETTTTMLIVNIDARSKIVTSIERVTTE